MGFFVLIVDYAFHNFNDSISQNMPERTTGHIDREMSVSLLERYKFGGVRWFWEAESMGLLYSWFISNCQ